MKDLLNFDWKEYIKCNLDLKKNWNGPIRARVHYYIWGIIEKRNEKNNMFKYLISIVETPFFQIPVETIDVKPKIINKENFDFVDYKYCLPVTNIYKLKNITVYNDLILNSDGEFLSQFSWFGSEFKKYKNNFIKKYENFFTRKNKTPQKLQGVSLYLSSTWAGVNIGHNVLDGLSRMACYDEAKVDLSNVDYFLVSNNCPEIDLILEMMKIPKNKIKNLIGNIYQCEQIIISEMPGYKRQYKKILKKYFKKIFNFDNPPQDQKILLMNRKTGRKIINDPELCNVAEKNNFKIFREYPSFLDFYNASVIMSPHSSTLFKLIFCRENTKVIELISNIHKYSYYYEISRVFDLDYIGILCNNEKTDKNKLYWDIFVDTKIVNNFLMENI